jgi:probable HAF family extracellular repeat protein
VNNHGQIVGEAMCVASGAPKAAFLWRDGVMHNLNDLIPSGGSLDLRSALDINDAGQIVGYGITPNEELHGFLLEPNLIGDINGDGEVGIADFLLLLADWGPCPDPPDPCPADLNGDGTVSVNDFLILLANWS